jgi:prepilin-type N-terminal cleavage/methylation domain-containing protein/prepilin-type processing-associated H-X9-DG protein
MSRVTSRPRMPVSLSRSIGSRHGFTLVELLVVIAIIAVLIGLLLPAVQTAREAARRSACSNKLKQLGLAMHSYLSTRKAFPSNVYHPNAGTNWTNWELLGANYQILPFIEEQSTFDRVNLDGSPAAMLGVIRSRLDAFTCPSDSPMPAAIAWGPCNYAWSTGSSPRAVPSRANANGFIHAEKRGTNESRTETQNTWPGRRVADFSDGLSKTIMGSELLCGTGNNDGDFPRNFALNVQDRFSGIANHGFATTAEVAAMGAATEAATEWRGRGGQQWGWYGHGATLFNTTVPPNWEFPSGGVSAPGWAYDHGNWCVFPPRSRHPGLVNAVMVDGAVVTLSNGIDLLTFQRLGHRSDGAPVALP